MEQQEEIEREQGAVEIQTANLRELARLVLVYSESKTVGEMGDSYDAMVNFAKGVAQCQPS